MPYKLLNGVRVLEVSLLAPGALGGHLADMGAEVIKIEEPPVGDYARTIGPQAVGGPDGLSLAHLHWNRGKKSVAMNLKSPEGKAAFLALAGKSDVVIEGLRSGALDRLGFGYEVLKKANPAIVFCSLSGFGRTGPYVKLASHGVLFDAYAGFSSPDKRPDGTYVRAAMGKTPDAGLNASGLWAALAVVSALYQASRTGQGTIVEVAGAEVAVHWNRMTLELVLNQDKIVPRKAYGVRDEQTASVRYSYYVTKDERLVLFMAPEEKFWDNFLRGLGREDLKTTYPPTYKLDHQPGDEGLRQELIKIFATRTQEEWVRFCIEHNVPCGPVHEAHEILSDPHFIARDNVYEVVQPETGAIKLLGTPIKVEAEEFSANPSPMLGQHTDEVLREILEYDDDQVAAIHRSITLAE